MRDSIIDVQMLDVAAKEADAWIAVKKKLTREQIASIRTKLAKLQDSLYTRNVDRISEAIDTALEENRLKDGPCNEAISEAREFYEKLKKYYEEEAVKKQEAKLKAEAEMEKSGKDTEKTLSADAKHYLPGAFPRYNPVEKTRRRLFVKTKLREAQAILRKGMIEKEQAADSEETKTGEDSSSEDSKPPTANQLFQKSLAEARACLEGVLRVEPRNADGEKALKEVKALEDQLNYEGSVKGPTLDPNRITDEDGAMLEMVKKSQADGGKPDSTSGTTTSSTQQKSTESEKPSETKVSDSTVTGSTSESKKAEKKPEKDFIDLDDDSEDEDDDPKSKQISAEDTMKLVATGTKYLQKQEFNEANHIFSYVLSQGQFPSAEEKVRVLLNSSMCLQKTKRVSILYYGWIRKLFNWN